MPILFEAFALVLCLTALFAYVNERWLRLPSATGIMALSLAGSLLLVLAGRAFPSLLATARQLTAAIDFPVVLMKLMLGFLLFAGSIQLSARELKRERIPIAVLSTAGTLLSTGIVGVLVWLLLPLFGKQLELIYCLVFGALISPTDPIAVLSILRSAGIRKSLEVTISGESLFNDGVAVVIFASLYGLAEHRGAGSSAAGALLLFLREAGGGLAWGLLLGYAGCYLIRSIDNHQAELLITLALVTGGYLLADRLGISGPLAMVAAGIITGNKSRDEAMSPLSRDYLSKFWELVDEVLNALLFFLIGLQLLVIPLNAAILALGAACIVLVLAARFLSVGALAALLRRGSGFGRGAVRVLTWGGLRGGISVALALSLPQAMGHDVFVPVTYIVVVFSILVQGLTIGRVAKSINEQ